MMFVRSAARSLMASSLVALALSLPSAAGAADGDAAAGKKVFNQCAACHSMAKGKNGLGPSLHGVVGRKAGTAEGFKNFSPAMKESNITWTPENISKYLANPKGFIPGNRMVFVGLKKDEDIANVIAFIQDASKN